MEKAILISIRPEHAVNILNGVKTLEIRRNVPTDFKGWVYIYVTKDGGALDLIAGGDGIGFRCLTRLRAKDIVKSSSKKIKQGFYNGKVVAKFWFDEFETLDIDDDLEVATDKRSHQELLKTACLDYYELTNYAMDEDGNVNGYAWVIKDLEVFQHDSLELTNFMPYIERTEKFLTRPPQSWQYVTFGYAAKKESGEGMITEEEVKKAYLLIFRWIMQENARKIQDGKFMTLLDTNITDQKDGRQFRLITHLSFYGKGEKVPFGDDNE